MQNMHRKNFIQGRSFDIVAIHRLIPTFAKITAKPTCSVKLILRVTNFFTRVTHVTCRRFNFSGTADIATRAIGIGRVRIGP